MASLIPIENKKLNYEHTKAICTGNECQDYLITCNDGTFIKMVPISRKVTFGENWVDIRKTKKLC